MTMPALPGHIWWHSIVDAQNHLYPVHAEGDEPEDGVYEAVCEKLVLTDRLVREEYGSYCFDCLLKLGEHQAQRLDNHLSGWSTRHLGPKGQQS